MSTSITTLTCIPPEKKRDARGNFFVRAPSGDVLPVHWSPYIGTGWWGYPINAGHKDAASWGWRYEGEITPPSVVEQLVAAGELLQQAASVFPMEDGSRMHCAVESMHAALQSAKTFRNMSKKL